MKFLEKASLSQREMNFHNFLKKIKSNFKFEVTFYYLLITLFFSCKSSHCDVVVWFVEVWQEEQVSQSQFINRHVFLNRK